MARFPRPQFSLKSLMLLTLGIAIGYAWNLWVWRLHWLPGTEANMTGLPTYIIEPPDILRIDVAGAASGSPATVSGQHLVAMDGRVTLGQYGSVYVAGMTIAQTEKAIRQQLVGKIDKPQVAVDVLAYNSKVYYVITEARGLGDDVTRLPITGNETALDAIAAVGGLEAPDATEIWIARPAPSGVGPQKVIPINYAEIAAGSATSNPQILPGDRVFISQKRPAAAKPAVVARTSATAAPAAPAGEADAPAPPGPIPASDAWRQ